MVKSKEELECVRRACEILGKAYIETFETVSPGMTENELAVNLRSSIFKHGAERLGFLVMNSASDHAPVASAEKKLIH